MLTAIQKALRVQRSTTKRLDGRKGRILRGDKSSNVTYTIGETRSDDINEEQQIVTVRYRDFLIDVVEYQFDGIPTKPREGDQIVAAGEIWTVHPTSSEPDHRRHDRDQTTWRIHTKKTGES